MRIRVRHPRWPVAAALLWTACATSPAPTPSPAPTRTPSVEATAKPTAPPAAAAAVHFQGEVVLPGDTKLGYAVTLERDGDAYQGTIDIPAQNVVGAALTDVVFEPGERVAFSLAVPGTATWKGVFATATGIECTFSQGPVTAGCTMQALSDEEYASKATVQARPQTPKPPFPYNSREVEYRNAVAAIKIAGTLTTPPGPGPHPAALLITGSGAQDRDETIFGHKPFAVLADALTRAGVAVLRSDDRGVDGTERGPEGATTSDFADDVRAGVTFLASQSAIDAGRIGLVGHSEGGLIAPIVAANNDDVAFIVLLAGPGVSGEEVLVTQVRRLALASGLSDSVATQKSKDQRALMAIALDKADEQTRADRLRAWVRRAAERDDEPAPTDAALDAVVRFASSPWFRHFARLDPGPYLRKVDCPVLVLNGELDVQVDAQQNATAIAKALRRGGNDDVTVQRLEGLNHLFQRAQTGAVSEYAQIEETFDPAALALVTDWVQRTTKR